MGILETQKRIIRSLAGNAHLAGVSTTNGRLPRPFGSIQSAHFSGDVMGIPAERIRHAGCLLTCVLLAAPAAAQWAWRDENGRLVFSDRPPPAGVKAEHIVRQPAAQPAPPPVTGDADGAKAGAKGEPKAGSKTIADRELEFRKRQQERADAERKQAEEQAQAARKAQDCERARGYLRSLEEGQRIARTDAQGNREILDDAQRAAEIQRMREVVARSCN
jgi:hypothetical protein